MFERKKVKSQIEKNGIYKTDGVELKRLEDDGESKNDPKKEHYVGTILTNNTLFTGTLNWKFQRDGFSFNKYPNGDKFLGYFSEDIRNRHGFYLWKPKNINGKISADFYHGYWENNLKNSNGCYLWIEEPENNNNFDNANFEAFIGNINNDEIKKGTYLIKNNDTYFVYYGSFNQYFKKNDNNAYFYSSTHDRLFKGKIQNDLFIQGFLAFFNDDGNLLELIYTEFDEEEQIKTVISENDLQCDQLSEIKENMKNFRNIILNKDYFGIIYHDYKECSKFISDHCSNYQIFEDKDFFPKIMDICSKYNNDNITKDINTILKF